MYLIILVSICLADILLVSTQQSACSQNSILGLVNINEGLPAGSIVRNLTEFSKSTDIVSVTIGSPNNAYFDFILNSKLLVSKIVFDAETQSQYSVLLNVVCDTSAKRFELLTIINDLNDEPAKWNFQINQNYYVGTINDDSENNTEITFDSQNQPKFSDRDNNKLNEVELLGLANQIFYISSSKTTSPVSIKTKVLLDYDNNRSFNLTLFLKDLNDATREIVFTANATLVINVIDKDSKLPEFLAKDYEFSIQNTAPNNSLFNISPSPVKAIDGDKALNIEINYRLIVNYDMFKLNPNTGELRTNQNNIIPQSIKTILEAYQVDNSNRKIPLPIVINIIPGVKKVNFTQSLINVEIEENKLDQLTKIQLAEPIDNVEYSMNPSLSNFRILSDGSVMVVTPLDYEKVTRYNITITGSNKISTDSCQLIIQVIDVNEFKPEFKSSSYSFRPNLVEGFVGRVEAIDGDLNTSVRYWMSNSFEIFNINDTTGDIYINLASKALQPRIFNLAINASDSGSPPMSTITFVIVDLSISTTAISQVSTTNPPISKEALLSIYILVPLFVVLIIIFIVLLFYYKRKRVYNANTSNDLSYEPDTKHRDSYIPRWDKSANYNEGFHDLYDLSGCERHVSQLRGNGSPGNKLNNESAICENIYYYRKHQKRQLVESNSENPTKLTTDLSINLPNEERVIAL